jgi:transposase
LSASAVSRKGKSKAQIENEVREREAEAVRLRTANNSYEEIARQLGWANGTAARRAIYRALDRHEEKGIDELRRVENAKIDWAEAQLVEIIEGFAPLVDHGKIMTMSVWDEERQQNVQVPLRDLKPVVAALREFRQLLGRRAALRGLDAPMRKVLEVIPADVVEREIKRIEAQSARMREELGLGPGEIPV